MALVDSFDGFIFDYGGVLVRNQTDADQALLAKLAGMPQEEFSERYWSLRVDYDKDLLTGAEYWQSVAQPSGSVLTPQTVDKLTEADTDTWMRFDSVMWDWIRELRKSGKRVAMLSNMPRDLGEALKHDTDRMDYFDYVTLSYELRSAKPEPAIYENCLEGIGTAPEKTIFFDDRIANVQGAEMLGMKAVQFLDRDDVLLQVRA
jgi:putative hydrolase of the HAD superfamily